MAEILEGFCRFDDKAVRITNAVSGYSKLNVCVVCEIPASYLSIGDRTFISRHGTRDSTGFEDVFCSGWVCPLYHRSIVAFHPLYDLFNPSHYDNRP